MSNETVRADLDITVYAECPNCEEVINLMDGNYNDDSAVISQACPLEGHWSEEHEKFEILNVTCTECDTEFDVKGLGW